MRRLSPVLAAALGLLAPLLTPQRAHGYVRTTTDRHASVKWPNSCVTVLARIANPPANLTPDLAAKAARAAAAVWSHDNLNCPTTDGSMPRPTSFELTITTSDTSDWPTANDQINNLVFRKTSWNYDPQALAITTVFAIQSSGTILDADVEINAVPTHKMFRWGDLIDGLGVEGPTEDLQNTLTHEFGHLLGLDHTCYLPGNKIAKDHTGQDIPRCDDASPTIMEATMFASVATGDTVRRSLAPDDIAGVCAIYPPNEARCPTVPPAGGGVGGDDGLAGGCALGQSSRGARSSRPAAGLLLLGAGLVVAGLVALSVRRRRGPRRG